MDKRCCLTCKWREKLPGGPDGPWYLAECTFPLPAYIKRVELEGNDGTDCPTWAAKEERDE